MNTPDETTGNREESRARSNANLRPFQPGQSGNPSGRPKKKPITELYERMLADPDVLAELEKATRKAISRGSMAMVLQVKEMAERVEGKVTQPVEATINVSATETVRRIRERVAQLRAERDKE